MLLNDKLFTAELNMLNGIINLSLLKWWVRYISNADNANNIYYYSEVKVNGLNVSSGN